MKHTRVLMEFSLLLLMTFLALGSHAFLTPSNSWALPIETDTALTVGFESNAIRSFARVTRKTDLLRNGDKVSDPNNTEVTVYSTPLVVPLRIKPNLVAIGVVPFLTIEKESTVSGQRIESASSGLGDLQLLVKHAFYRKDALKRTTRLAWLAGIKLPTGDETETPALGSASVDFIIGGILTRIVDRIAVHADLKYKINTEAHGVRAGNSLKHDLALEYRVIPKKFQSISDKTVNLILELNALYVEADKGIGATVSGGETLFLSPGVQVVVMPRMIIEGLFQYPIVQKLRGTQLGVDYTASIGFRFSF